MFLGILPSLFLSACSDDNGNPPNERGEIQITRSESEIILNSNYDFGFKIFSGISKSTDNNFVYSPMSLSMTMGMIANGAASETKDEIIDVIGSKSSNIDELNILNRKILESIGTLDNTIRISLANSIWVVNNLAAKLEPDFKNSLLESYQCEFSYVDNFSKPDAISTINNWVKAKTNGLIPSLFEDTLPYKTSSVIANALYFKGIWSKPFEKGNTKKELFNNYSGTESLVDMMSGKLSVLGYKDDGYSAIALPYGNGAFSMIIILPDKDKDIDFVMENISTKDIMDLSKHENIGAAYNWTELNIKLPKFTVTYSSMMNKYLNDAGLTKIFDKEIADLSGMFGDIQQEISFIKQNVYICVDEEGTVAAAVTGSGWATSPGPIEYQDFFVDRPFVFMITEQSTGIPLFMGQIKEL